MTKTQSKREQALEIVGRNPDKSRKQVIEILREKLGMTEAGASTYYYNAQQELKKVDKKNVTSEVLSGNVVQHPAAKKAATKKKATTTKKKEAEPETASAEGDGGKHWSETWAENKAQREAEISKIMSDVKDEDIPDFLRKSWSNIGPH